VSSTETGRKKQKGRSAQSPCAEESMTQEQEIEQDSIPEEVQEVQAPVDEQPKRNDADHNWQEANQLLRSQKQKIEYLEQKVGELEQVKQSAEPDELAGLEPSDYLTFDKAQKLAEKKAKEAAQHAVESYAKQMTLQQDEMRVRSKYQDYDYVIQNFAGPLIQKDPALAYRVMNSSNPAETAYRLGKLSDEYVEQTTKQQVSPKAEKIMKNLNRPLSGNAVAGPLKNQADQISNMSADEIWSLSQRYAKGG